ncbi:sulfatase-like hydrolase/transferase [Paracoccus onubensis]|nr:sulfatase-like hydrolase/transferase [Paracoccus onubensis]
MPNILNIASDDLFSIERYRSVFGHVIQTPNLDAFYASGCKFEAAMATIAVCAPSRCSVLTGLSPYHSGLFDIAEAWYDLVRPEQSLQWRIKQAGFYMGTTGKMWHGYVPQPDFVYDALYDSAPFTQQGGIPENVRTDQGPSAYGGNSYSFPDDIEDNSYDGYRVLDFQNFLNTYSDSRPWYHEVGFHHPHGAWTNPDRFFDAVPLEDIIFPTEWSQPWEIPTFAMDFIGGDASLYDPATWSTAEVETWRYSVRAYIASVMYLDYNLGRVLAALDASPFADDTVVCFWSDHGYHLGDRGQKWHKFTLWDEAARAPLAIRAPGQAPRVVTEPVSLIDLTRTLVDYAGGEAPIDWQGESLRPVIEGGAVPARAIPTFWYGSASARIGDRRIILYQDGTSEYYDLATDPWAQVNLAGMDAQYEAHRTELIDICEGWGLKFVEQGAKLDKPSPLASYLGVDPDVGAASGALALVGSMDARGQSPGYQRALWVPKERTSSNEVVKFPDHIDDFLLATRAAVNATIHMGSGPNRVLIEQGWWGRPTFYLGDGDDEIKLGKTVAVVHGGRGNDTIQGGQRMLLIHGGPGDDSITGTGSADELHGDAGNDTISGGGGNDTIDGGSGINVINGGAGADTIIISAGKNTITLGAGADTVIARRTGYRQIITDLASGDTLDLSDWAGIQPVSVVQAGSDVVVSATYGPERIICQGVTAATVTAAISGATVA